MKRKRGAAKRKSKTPLETSDVCVNPAPYNEKHKETDALNSTMEVGFREADASMIAEHLGSNRSVANNETVGSNAAKLARALSSSSKIAASDKDPLKRYRIGENKQKYAHTDPVYNKQELDVAYSVIKKIMKMDAATPFNDPVDPIALGIPDYFDVIDTPMDFGTICNSLEKGFEYRNSNDVFKDVQRIWDNCCKYNKQGSYILELMKRVKINFMKQWNAAGLFKEQQTVNNGLPLHTPQYFAESTMINENVAPMHPMSSTISSSRYLQRHDFACLNQMQHQHFSPCCGHTMKIQQPSHICPSSLHSGQSQTILQQHDFALNRNHCMHLHSMDPMNGNSCDQRVNEENPCLLHSSRPPHNCSIIGQQPQITCLHESSSSQLPPSQVHNCINTQHAENQHVPPPTECTAKGTGFGTGCPRPKLTDHISYQQADKINSGPEKSWSMANLEACQPLKKTCQNQLGSGPSECFQPTDDNIFSKRNTQGEGYQQFGEQSSSTMNSQEGQPQDITSQNQTGFQHSRPSSSRADKHMKSKRRSRGRGPTMALNFRDNERISVSINEQGQPVGPGAQKLVTFLGTLARNGNFLPLTYLGWRAVPLENKENMWQKVQMRFEIDPMSKDWVLQSLGIKWKNWKANLKTAHYHPHGTDEERLADRDERVLPDQWAALIAYWNSELGQKCSARNRANRSKVKYNHAAGTKSFARIREEMRAKQPDGKELSREELFLLTRTRKDGKPVNPKSSEVITRLCERRKDQDNPQDNDEQADVLSEIIGSDKRGYPRCIELCQSPSNLKKSARFEAAKTTSEANAEIREIKEKVAVMEQACTQMASQMAAMMAMMSSLQKKLPENAVPDTVANTPGPPESSLPRQEHNMPSPSVGSTRQMRTCRSKRRI